MEIKIAKIYKFELNFQNAYVWKAYIWKDKFLKPKNIAFIKVYFRATYSGTPCMRVEKFSRWKIFKIFFVPNELKSLKNNMSFFVFFHAWWVGGSEASVEFYTLFLEPFPKMKQIPHTYTDGVTDKDWDRMTHSDFVSQSEKVS